MKVKDLRILARHFDPHIDGYVVLGRRKDDGAMRRYVVAWHSRHQNNRIISRKSFHDIRVARQHFGEATTCTGASSHHTGFQQDWQDRKVYRWEEDCLEHRATPITKRQAQELIRAVSADYGIPAPALLWRKNETHYSDFCAAKNKIRFGHRTDLALLHEMAHAVNEYYHASGAFHGPLFVWTAIKIYHRYLGLGMGYLASTARRYGLLGDMDLRRRSLFRAQEQQPVRRKSYK